MASPLHDPKLEALLDRLHAQNDAQADQTNAHFARRGQEVTLDQGNFFDEDMHRFLSDKMVALDRDKALFCYQLCRSLRAGRVVEAGTSFGVSTLYLAAAVRDNQVENGVVIGTEYEPKKAKSARATFKEAELGGFIELREGGLRQTLGDVGGRPFLIAVVARDGQKDPPTEVELRTYSRRWLPSYMIPSVIHIVDVLPLTANGKIDYVSTRQRWCPPQG